MHVDFFFLQLVLVSRLIKEHGAGEDARRSVVLITGVPDGPSAVRLHRSASVQM